MNARSRLSNADLLRLAAEAHLDPRTVLVVLDGDGRQNTREAVRDAAARLGLNLPAPIENAPPRIRAT